MSDFPSTIGRYRIIDVIGRGGMGVVYRAEHAETGELVAIKTLRGVHESLLSGFRHEIRALARISHPGIVRILDTGVRDGIPWYAMDLVDGPNMRAYVRRVLSDPLRAIVSPEATTVVYNEHSTHELPTAPDTNPIEFREPLLERRREMTPEALATVLRLVRRVCAPLAFLHGEGIVHRDLKPDNILVARSGMPVLVDFGVASFFAAEGREELEALHVGWGTVSYMAPEQIQGEFVDARADLYALGCILYELLTGRPPFVPSRLRPVVKAHLSEDPVPPSRFDSSIPREVDALTLKLLAKHPGDRIGYAEDVAAEIARMGYEDVDPDGPPPRPYLYRTGFAGREAALGQLEARVASLREHEGGLVLVSGESGVGKTRFLQEAGREAHVNGIRVATGECPPVRSTEEASAAPLFPFRETLRTIADLCIGGGPEETRRLVGYRARVLAPYEPALASLPGWDESPAEPVELPVEAGLFRLYLYLMETLTALAEERPLMLVLDDLQWADELTLGFLRFLLLTHSLEAAPLLIVGSYRAEESTPDLQPLVEATEATHIALGRLDEPAVAAAIGDMLALTEVPPELSAFLCRYSEGNPFFVGEYLRAAVEEGFLRRSPEGFWRITAAPGTGALAYERIPLPTSLRELIGRRLRDLPAPVMAVLETAAVLGREASLDLLERVGDFDETTAGEAVRELIRRHVFAESRPGFVRFSHDKLRELSYERMDPDRRRILHRATAEALTASGAASPARLGLHWAEAGETEKARACYLEGARLAKNRYALDEAERLYRAYLDLVEQPTEESIAVRNELGHDVLRVRGRGPEAVAEARRAVEDAVALGLRGAEGTALWLLGSTLREVGDEIEELRRSFERALEIAREIGARRLEGSVIGALGLYSTDAGRLDEAAAYYEQALEIAREVGDRDLEARVLNNYAYMLSDQGRLDEAVVLCERALEIYREIGDRRMEGVTLGNVGTLNSRLGRHANAQPLHEQALAIHREIGNRRHEGIALLNLAVVAVNTEHSHEAYALYEHAAEVLRSTGDRRTEGVILTNLGQLSATNGRTADAFVYFERALDMHRKMGNRRLEGITHGYRAMLERRQGDYAAAEADAEHAIAILGEVGDSIYEAVFMCERGHLALARGESAQQILDEITARLSGASTEHGDDLDEALTELREAQGAFEGRSSR